jgi:hypothetical protein
MRAIKPGRVRTGLIAVSAGKTNPPPVAFFPCRDSFFRAAGAAPAKRCSFLPKAASILGLIAVLL